MCGIVGYIGKSNNASATFELTNNLMVFMESRGEHATGFWATTENDNKVIYHKEPKKSSQFVRDSFWKNTQNYDIDLFLGHCRYTSIGVGSERINKNNHPHVSDDYKLALVHNGRIPEYSYLKNKYKVKTDCDSEIILRIFESCAKYFDQNQILEKELPKIWKNTPQEIMYRFLGLKKVFTEINYGAMAFAIAERVSDNKRSLFIYRNKHRPICIIDLRKTLGQIFFCSSPEIFKRAYDECSNHTKKYIPHSQEINEVQEDWLYSFYTEYNNFQIRKIKIFEKRKYGNWEEEKEPEIKESKNLESSSFDVIKLLNDNEDLPIKPQESEKKKTKNNHYHYSCNNVEENFCINEFNEDNRISSLRREKSVSNKILDKNKGFQEQDIITTNYPTIEDLDKCCKKIINSIKEIETDFYNKIQESSLSNEEIVSTYDSLQQILADIESTKCCLGLSSSWE